MEAENEKKKPLAIFHCGPIAAGKSSTIKFFKEKDFDQGVEINYDNIFKSEYERLSKENSQMKKQLPDQQIADIADKSALAAREKIFDRCIEKQIPFSYENCMPDHVFNKMERAKQAGFDVKVYVTFQKDLSGHLFSEKLRRTSSKETGAFFLNDDIAKNAVKGTYYQCVNGVERALKHCTSMKVFINYMKGEDNRPVMVASYDENKSKQFVITPGAKIDNTDLDRAFKLIKAKEVKNTVSINQDKSKIKEKESNPKL